MATSISKELSSILGDSNEAATPGKAKYKDTDADVHPSLSGAGIDISNAKIDSLTSMMQDLPVTVRSIFRAVSNPDEYKTLTMEEFTARQESETGMRQQRASVQVGARQTVTSSPVTSTPTTSAVTSSTVCLPPSTVLTLNALAKVEQLIPQPANVATSASASGDSLSTRVSSAMPSLPVVHRSLAVSTMSSSSAVTIGTHTGNTVGNKGAIIDSRQPYRYSSRGDVVAALLLSIIDNIKQHIEVREKQQFQSRSHTLFTRVTTAISVAVKMFRIEIGVFTGRGYTDVTSMLASSDRYPTRSIDFRVYQSVLTSPPVIEFSRAIGAVVEKLKLVPEIFDPPGDYVMFLIEPSLVYPHGNDFALASDVSKIPVEPPSQIQMDLRERDTTSIRMYITARMSGFNESQSYQYMTLLPKLKARDSSFTVPEVRAAESIKAVLSEECMYT
ncbi:hypothetical protein BDK51DRAFT_46688 [Blyttiomyces helicus]|uniref:Uncharacterized protein n=1 Tax=Blyttiomyces helicus TaxID=388810 RepID=A0A4P9W3H6_9FUNG|nr:hypothetical protein BDK51DRAFT_46688 [Blyttiomyces helicus]|eukprot:RKO85845.1 hypothetical protein BDK51DRAFT_46688 [Blyttiomyces helicus]